jgi:Zn-dependent protease/CBS domain-containing protein
MGHKWRLGKIFGIEIDIDSSWLIIFILFTWVLGGSYFPREYPHWSKSLYWIMGLATSLLVFVSVLLHELAHSLVALKQGETVQSITLFILGGVSQITEEPKEPLKELAMAIVGPGSSFVIAAVFFFLSRGLRGVSLPLAASATYLAVINAALGVFNLVPGFPMDGGRVLRSIIWKATGNLKKATHAASLVGQGIAFLLIFFGVLEILRGALSGLWWILIGWFLHHAAVRGYSEVMIRSVLEGMKAENLMTKDFETVPGELSVQALVDDYILKKKERVFLVSDGGDLKGIVCLEDVRQAPKEKWSQARVRDIMTPRERLEAVAPDTDGNKILASLVTKNIHQVPVMKGGKVEGIICRTDVIRYIQMRSELGG